jgi:hypothetical protein
MLEEMFSHSALIIVENLPAATEASASLEWQAAWVAFIQVTTTCLQLVDDQS